MSLKLGKRVVTELVVETPVAVQKIPVESVPMTEVEALTATYIVLHREYVAHNVKNLCKQMEDIKKKLQTVANESMDATKPAIFKCEEGEVEFTERGKVAEVTNPEELIDDLALKFGMGVAFSVVNIAITPLRKILSSLELEKYLKETPGSRTLKDVRPVEE